MTIRTSSVAFGNAYARLRCCGPLPETFAVRQRKFHRGITEAFGNDCEEVPKLFDPLAASAFQRQPTAKAHCVLNFAAHLQGIINHSPDCKPAAAELKLPRTQKNNQDRHSQQNG